MSSGNSDCGGAVVDKVHNEVALCVGSEVSNVGVAGGVGKLNVLKAEKLGGNLGNECKRGICGVAGKELILNKVIDCKLRSVCGIEGKALVYNCNGEESPVAIGSVGLSIDYREIYGANLTVELVEPSKVRATALSVNVGTGIAVEIVDVVVDEVAAINSLNKSGNLEDGGGDILGNRGIHNTLNGSFGYPA